VYQEVQVKMKVLEILKSSAVKHLKLEKEEIVRIVDIRLRWVGLHYLESVEV
jgi:hypothetical protein